jgi:hypothetical protein
VGDPREDKSNFNRKNKYKVTSQLRPVLAVFEASREPDRDVCWIYSSPDCSTRMGYRAKTGLINEIDVKIDVGAREGRVA